MAKAKNSKKSRPSRRTKKLNALAAAMLAIPGMSTSAEAQSRPSQPEVHFQYSDFQEHQGSNEDRMHINVPQFYFRTPVLSQGAFEGTYTYDGMTGASPLFLDSLTGASGLGGVDDERHAGTMKYTHYAEDFSIAGGLALSDEDDWNSIGGVGELQTWSEDKNAILSLGFSGTQDDIRSTNQPDLDENRTTYKGFVGLTQVINPELITQWNVIYTSASGYHTDPYKTFDNRPNYRDEIALMARAVQYLESIDGSLHGDYRFYYNNHGIASHTLESALYFPIGERGIGRVRGRYYTQTAADYFGTEFTEEVLLGEKYFSADQRVSAFGSYLLGLRYDHQVIDGLTLFGSCDFSQQDSKFRSGGTGSFETPRLTMMIFSVGFQKAFDW